MSIADQKAWRSTAFYSALLGVKDESNITFGLVLDALHSDEYGTNICIDLTNLLRSKESKLSPAKIKGIFSALREFQLVNNLPDGLLRQILIIIESRFLLYDESDYEWIKIGLEIIRRQYSPKMLEYLMRFSQSPYPIPEQYFILYMDILNEYIKQARSDEHFYNSFRQQQTQVINNTIVDMNNEKRNTKQISQVLEAISYDPSNTIKAEQVDSDSENQNKFYIKSILKLLVISGAAVLLSHYCYLLISNSFYTLLIVFLSFSIFITIQIVISDGENIGPIRNSKAFSLIKTFRRWIYYGLVVVALGGIIENVAWEMAKPFWSSLWNQPSKVEEPINSQQKTEPKLMAKRMFARTNARIRQKPSMSSAILESINKGDVIMIGSKKGNWLEVIDSSSERDSHVIKGYIYQTLVVNSVNSIK